VRRDFIVKIFLLGLIIGNVARIVRCPDILGGYKLRVMAAGFEKFVVCAFLDDFAIRYDCNVVGILNRG